MPVIEVQPYTLKDVTFITSLSGGASSDYKKHLSGVTFTPTASTVTWNGLGSNSFTDVATATWVCTLDYAQDWETTDSLSRFLHEHEGEEIEVTFKPVSSKLPTIEATLIVTPGAIGGAFGAVASASVSLGVNGRPELV
ncbi:hypothetical protein [Cellulosimicrobium sp. SL-1]|uniref:hypothetical protein n=1 Tax=Cellulosimicrobium sp. SL-1 TaxID=2699423 RepID=UPI0013D52F60|nr:hypothetical protein [Cellulosimicrobium sp. SL-1]